MGYIDYLRNRENRENNESTKLISRSQFGIWMSSIVTRIAAIFLFFSNRQDRTIKEVIQLMEKEEKRDGGDTREEDRCMRDS